MDFQRLGVRFWMIFQPPEPFLWVPHRIWRDMCEAFQVEELALMIRATRGRSMDRSVDWSIDAFIGAKKTETKRTKRIERTEPNRSKPNQIGNQNEPKTNHTRKSKMNRTRCWKEAFRFELGGPLGSRRSNRSKMIRRSFWSIIATKQIEQDIL